MTKSGRGRGRGGGRGMGVGCGACLRACPAGAVSLLRDPPA
ncbi:MAG: hypothetical protein RDU30_05315 [Desulfovibrionaceae bacterium]|nr:hypothetical protein [Desulfovibrionaceae bacterium]